MYWRGVGPDEFWLEGQPDDTIRRVHDAKYAYSEGKPCPFPGCGATIMDKSTTCRIHREWHKAVEEKAHRCAERLAQLVAQAEDRDDLGPLPALHVAERHVQIAPELAEVVEQARTEP